MYSFIHTFIIIWFLIITAGIISGQKTADCPGWSGELVISDEDFYNVSNWTANASDGSSCIVTTSDTSINLHWRLAAGNNQWVQCYMILPEPISLSKYDIFGFDLHGSACEDDYPCHKEQVVEVKFEDGTYHAYHTRMGEDGILCVDRWINRLFFHRYDNFFTIPAEFNWDSVQVISFGIKSHPWVDNPSADSGVFSFRNLVADSTGGWARHTELEVLSIQEDTLNIIRQKALDFILSRQTSTGLLTTWAEDGSSWLYGQGLTLKILTLEGEWDEEHNPVNEYAEAARKLAHFLAENQQDEGYWPRAWNSYSGNVLVMYEADGSIWMGDFPWMLTGLYSYLKKSNDCYVLDAINRGTDFLKSMIDADGNFHTLVVPTGNRIPVTSSEAYAAAIGALLELGEDELADLVISYIHNLTWDDNLLYWREGTYSNRVVLFTNTWLSLLLHERGYEQESLNALTLAGSLMYTCGPGVPCGLDGIGPIATWYEGTLSYIAAGGCGSNILFNTIRPFINSNGSVPHYNDDIGGTAGIWAEKWASLDGTSWLYYVAAASSPFEVVLPGQNPDCPNGLNNKFSQDKWIKLYPNPCKDYLTVAAIDTISGKISIQVLNLLGQTLMEILPNRNETHCSINISNLKGGVYILIATVENKTLATKFIKE